MTAVPLHDPEGRPLGRGGLAFTAEQAVAVLRREGPMLLAANAGSGKTAVLAERFARAVVEDGLDPGSLLAITFTDKAAGELRHRIRLRLAELGAQEAARAADQAWISTIHGFCTRVLRAHAAAAGVDPAFEVLDESVARRLRADAFDAALAAVLDTADPMMLATVATWGADRLTDAVLEVHDALRSRGQRHPRLPAAVPRRTRAAACGALAAARDALAAELAAAPENATVLQVRDALGRCAEVLERGGDLGDVTVRELGAPRRGRALQTPAADAYRDALAALLEVHDDEEGVRHHALLDALLRDFSARYEAAKTARAGLDYDDLELVARDLLRDQPAIARHLAQRFGRVMVDEFQDTNPRQLELLELLGHEDLFVVGDALQSIYGFRHADVRVFQEARARHRIAGTEAQLRTNWRTAPEILRTLDHALGHGHDDYTGFVAGRADAAQAGRPATSLLLVDAAVAEDPSPQDEEALAAVVAGLPAGTSVPTALEARAVARWVRAGVDAGEHEPQDVVLLLRAATDMPVYERALELEGLSTLASGGRGFWLRQQVQDLTAWLAALANPQDGHAVLSALASPLGGIDPDGLAICSSVARRGTAGDVWRLLDETYPDPPAVPGTPSPVAADLRRRVDGPTDVALAAFTARFRAARERLPWLGLDELIERVVQETGYDAHVLALPGGPRRLANVHKLMRLAAEHEALAGRDLRSFIDRAQEEAQARAREPEAPVELPGIPAVRLMTVHAAKGLEFPVVVACDLARTAPAVGPDVLVDGDRLGLRVPRHGGESGRAFAFTELDAERAAAAESEERRILHVGLTRAERRLVMSAVAKRRRDGDIEARKPSGWIAEGVLGSRVPPAELLAEGRLLVGPGVDDPVRVDVRWIDARAARAVLPPADAAPLTAGSAAQGAPDPLAALGPVLATVTGAEPGAGPAPVAHLSYSSLRQYARCGLRFDLERIAGLRERERPFRGRTAAGGLDGRARGSIVHRVLELHELDGPPPGPQAVHAAAAEHEVELRDAEAHALAGLVGRALATPLLGRLRDAVRVRRETSFTIPLVAGDPAVPVLHGVVDVVAQEAAGTALVVDYKTDRVASDADLDALVADGYGLQRTVYALAALEAGAARVDVAHLYLDRPDEPVLASFAAADAPGLREDLRGRAAGILRRDFRPTDTPGPSVCGGCPGRGGLCPVPLERTLAVAPAPAPEDSGTAPGPVVDTAAPRPRRARGATPPPGQDTLF
ncbi:UvrD-helicase domain-containing protein [Paraconexibacter algicola]|uniref:DNA 3'-5' helicase n=1 Tax=Paraconexibacter algicola TaxID=2133960 RepID=A0A2T4UF80_9ACTN|nr:UvrD-helicase domain-containing protein [Paraconexibacter algicola]PTL56436.1 hypothetical protein C7Y72_15865 [Paraconexibacter algicola]